MPRLSTLYTPDCTLKPIPISPLLTVILSAFRSRSWCSWPSGSLESNLYHSFFKKKGNVNITRSLSKMPLGKLCLWLYSLSFSTFLFFPFLHVKLSGRLWSRRHASSLLLPLAELPPATGRQFHRNPLILSSLTSVHRSREGPPARKRDTTRKKVCTPVSGSLKPKAVYLQWWTVNPEITVYLQQTQSSQFPRLCFETAPGNQCFVTNQKHLATRALWVIQNGSCVPELWANYVPLIRTAFQMKRWFRLREAPRLQENRTTHREAVSFHLPFSWTL